VTAESRNLRPSELTRGRLFFPDSIDSFQSDFSPRECDYRLQLIDRGIRPHTHPANVPARQSLAVLILHENRFPLLSTRSFEELLLLRPTSIASKNATTDLSGLATSSRHLQYTSSISLRLAAVPPLRFEQQRSPLSTLAFD